MRERIRSKHALGGWAVVALSLLGTIKLHAEGPLDRIQDSMDLSAQAQESAGLGRLEQGSAQALNAFQSLGRLDRNEVVRVMAQTAESRGGSAPESAHSRLVKRPDIPIPAVGRREGTGLLAKLGGWVPTPAKRFFAVKTDDARIGVFIFGILATMSVIGIMYGVAKAGGADPGIVVAAAGLAGLFTGGMTVLTALNPFKGK